LIKIEDENWKTFNGNLFQCFESHFDTYNSHTETYMFIQDYNKLANETGFAGHEIILSC
jgi:hypothetical protein